MLQVCQSYEIESIVSDEEIDAQKYIDNINVQLTIWTNRVVEAEWAYETNVTTENEKYQNDVTAAFAEFTKVVPCFFLTK